MAKSIMGSKFSATLDDMRRRKILAELAAQSQGMAAAPMSSGAGRLALERASAPAMQPATRGMIGAQGPMGQARRAEAEPVPEAAPQMRTRRVQAMGLPQSQPQQRSIFGRPVEGIARAFGYDPISGMSPLAYMMSGNIGPERIKENRLTQAEERKIAQYDQFINELNLSPQEASRARIAMRSNPEEFGKNLAAGFGTNVLSPGSMLNQGFGVAPVMNPKGEELPDSVRALQKRADLAGLAPGTPEYREFMMRGGAKSEPTTVINTGVPKYYEVGPGINPATGQRGMFGINPQTGQFEPIGGMAPLSGTSAEFNAKAQSMLPQAFTGLATITNLFKDGKSPLNAVNEQAAEYAQNIPVIGPQIAKTAGGKEWQAFNQAWAAIKQTVHIPAGAAVSAQEFQSFIDANKPALGDNDVTVQAKLRNTALFLNGLSAAAAGDPNGVRRFEQMYEQAKQQSLQLLNPSQSQLTPEQQAEGRALEEELRRLQGG